MKSKLRVVIIIASVFIVGCTPSFTKMRDSGPYKTYVSSGNVKEVAECILFGWQKDTNHFTNYGEIYIQPRQEGGFTVYSHGRLELVDIYEERSETRVNFYYHGGFKYRIENKIAVTGECSS